MSYESKRHPDLFIDINNVGSMSQALYAHNNAHYDEVEASGWQAAQVSAISLMNFSGRIFIGALFTRDSFKNIERLQTGLVSDFAKNKYGMPRSYCLVLVSFFFFISQLVTATEDRIENLWVASALLGLAHGSVFSLFPTVCLEWFGMRKLIRLSAEHHKLTEYTMQLIFQRTGATCQCHP